MLCGCLCFSAGAVFCFQFFVIYVPVAAAVQRLLVRFRASSYPPDGCVGCLGCLGTWLASGGMFVQESKTKKEAQTGIYKACVRGKGGLLYYSEGEMVRGLLF